MYPSSRDKEWFVYSVQETEKQKIPFWAVHTREARIYESMFSR